MERRDVLQWGAMGVFGLVTTASHWLGQSQPAIASELPSSASQPLTPDAALQKLMDGNRRFTQHQLQHPDQSQSRLQEVAQAQHPFATVLSCADSRVPVEIIFDQGIGDIFDVRVAGNIATPETIGSIEYAVALLGTPVLMVLGHERCGAVTAAVSHETLPGQISSFVNAILPAVDRAKGQSGDAVDNVVKENVYYQIDQLKRSPLLSERIESGQLVLVGGRYDLDTGSVEIIT